MIKFINFWYIILGYCLLGATTSWAQTFNIEFGKNRVQYHDNEWSFYETENYLVYFYQGGQDLAKYVITEAELNKEYIESKLEHTLPSKIEIMVYHNNSDLRQTNIGYQTNENLGSGLTQINANKVFLYFNGDHTDLRRQLLTGIAKVYLENLLFGVTLQEIIQNAVLLNLPQWYINGLVSYIGEDWNTELDDKLRQSIEADSFEKFNNLEGAEATFAGHALWHYIVSNFGEAAIPNILYLTRINRNADTGFLFVLGNDMNGIIESWLDYTRQIYTLDTTQREELPNSEERVKTVKKKENTFFLEHARYQPAGDNIAYATNESGLLKVCLYDTNTQKSHKLLKSSFKSFNLPIERNYPILCWSQDGSILAVIYEKRDKIMLRLQQMSDKNHITYDITKFQQVVDACFGESNNTLYLSAMRNGQMDLFEYTISNTKVTALTNDFFDELHLQFVNLKEKDRKGLIFSSNRLDDTLREERFDSILPAPTYDLYFYDFLHTPQNQVLSRLTNTPLANETQSFAYTPDYFAYLGDENGINNLYALRFDTTLARIDTLVYFAGDSLITNATDWKELDAAGMIDSVRYKEIYKETGFHFPLTNYQRNISEVDVDAMAKRRLFTFEHKENYEIFSQKYTDLTDTDGVTTRPTVFRKRTRLAEENKLSEAVDSNFLVKPIEVVKAKEVNESDTKKDTSTQTIQESANFAYEFQSNFDWLEKYDTLRDTKENDTGDGTSFSPDVLDNINALRRSRVRTYAPRFAVDYIDAELDNSIMFNRYESFNANVQAGLFVTDLQGLIKIGTSDLMEDYRVIGGFRLPFNFSGSEYFVEYQNLKKRLDKKLLLYRKVDKNSYSIPVGDFEYVLEARNYNTYIQSTFIYPLDIIRSLRFYVAYRNDKISTVSQDTLTLNFPSYEENWVSVKAEYVFDNTIQIAQNILNGTRWKIYAEAHQQMDISLNESDVIFKTIQPGTLYITGIDFRHYQRVHRNIIWANRLAGAYSFGNRKMVYYLGAVENWWMFDQTKKFDYETPFSETANYAFQATAPNLRGFPFNVRNGSKFAVFNSELRVPLFAYLVKKPIRSEFLRNFQLVGFSDLGTAWETGFPWDEANRYYTYQYGNPAETPVSVQVQYFKNPIVFGYGWGLRSKILGYFVKFDSAWGIDSGKRNNRMMYISLGTDF